MPEIDWDGIDCFDIDTDRYRDTVAAVKKWVAVLGLREPADDDLYNPTWRRRVNQRLNDRSYRNEVVAFDTVIIRYLQPPQCGICFESVASSNAYIFPADEIVTWTKVRQLVSSFVVHELGPECLLIEETSQ